MFGSGKCFKYAFVICLPFFSFQHAFIFAQKENIHGMCNCNWNVFDTTSLDIHKSDLEKLSDDEIKTIPNRITAEY